MPLNYLDRSQDLYAIGGVGNAFNNAAMALAQNRLNQQRLAQQAALEGAYLSLAQQKSAREGQQQGMNLQLDQAQLAAAQRAQQVSAAVGRLAAQRRLAGPGLIGIVQDPQSGPMLMNDLRSAGAIPQGPTQFTQEQLIQAINAALAGQYSGQAALSPGTAERMTEPVPVRSNEQLRDPFDLSQVLATGPAPQATPMLPEEQQLNQARIAEQQSLARLHDAQREKTSRPTPAKPLTTAQAIAQRIAAGKGQGAQAMPSSKDQLVTGQVYQTSRGPARWNGTAFEQ